jgi:hypothetical protein
MTIEAFDHLSAFGIASAAVPVRKVAALFATEAQLEPLNELLREKEPPALSMGEIREPDLSRVNYAEPVRGAVWNTWRPLAEDPGHVPPVQLLGRLDSTWKAAEKQIGDEVQERAGKMFATRAQQKADIIQDEAARIAADHGLTAAIRWLEALKHECEGSRKRIGQQLTAFTERKRKQVEALGQTKDQWADLLKKDDAEMGNVVRRFFLLAAGVLIAGYALWFFTIPVTSLIGMAAVVTFIALAVLTTRPLFTRLHLNKRTTIAAAQLTSAYRTSSLASLDEMTKRHEFEYPTTLSRSIETLIEACRDRLAVVTARQTELVARRDELKATLRAAPPTTRVLLRQGEALNEWYKQGLAQLPLMAWIRRLVSLREAPDWDLFGQEATAAFAFLHDVSAEAELYRLYPERDARMEMLKTLRDAAVDCLVALDLSAAISKPPQVYLFVEVEDGTTSELVNEINRDWSNSGVGIIITPTSDPAEITFTAILYGYRCDAQRDWGNIDSAFQRLKEREGYGIYPFLLGDECQAPAAPAPRQGGGV